MGCRIRVDLPPVVRPGDDGPVANDDGPDRDLALGGRRTRFGEREIHEEQDPTPVTASAMEGPPSRKEHRAASADAFRSSLPLQIGAP